MDREASTKKHELIFVPAPGIGHIVSTLEFASRLLNNHDQITITVLVMKLPNAPDYACYPKSLIASHPRIELIEFPDTVPPPPELLITATEKYIDTLMESYKPHCRTIVNNIISSRSKSDPSTRIAALFLDFFCVSMIDVGHEFGLPSYIFFTSGANFLSFLLNLPARHEEIGREFRMSDPELLLPGFVNPVPVQVLPVSVFNTLGAYAAYVKFASKFKESKGIVVNTFLELESRAISSFSDYETPPIYPVGPLLNLKAQPHPEYDHVHWTKIMNWLDKQPQSSVLFLCFGSYGNFRIPQIEEIAIGLERSGFRFLWSLRPPSKIMPNVKQFKNPEEILPAGFQERFGERGIICGWTPQVEVLAHKAIGGFMSHCGWNSILESLWHGVPILTLPIYAEQQLNAFTLVNELGLAMELRLDYNLAHLVKADEIERAVKCIMESDSLVRKKVKEMREKARKAVMKDGSSPETIAELIKVLTCKS